MISLKRGRAAIEKLVEPHAPMRSGAEGPSARETLTKEERAGRAERLRSLLALHLFSPLQGTTLTGWSGVARRGWRSMGPPFWPRAMLLTTTSLANTILARYEDRAYRRALARVEVPPPLFILGHYRSGTTHLQNLLSLDRNFAYPNLYQSFFPHTFLTTERCAAPLVAMGLVRKKFQDNVALNVASPMEDEIALCVATGLSPHMSWALPRCEADYDRYLTFRGVPAETVELWKRALLLFVRKLSLKSDKPLILKSPPHTARIRLLLEIFPDARFVHIHRDPYAVFDSTVRMLERIYPYWNVQTDRRPGREEARVERTLTTYRVMHDAFFEERSLIPEGRFHELGYSDLERDPEESLRGLYAGLGLRGIDEYLVAVRSYLASISGYRKNSPVMKDATLRTRVATEWERCFLEWGYPT